MNSLLGPDKTGLLAVSKDEDTGREFCEKPGYFLRAVNVITAIRNYPGIFPFHPTTSPGSSGSPGSLQQVCSSFDSLFMQACRFFRGILPSTGDGRYFLPP